MNNILKILNILAAYAEGDFGPVLEKLPGKQVLANEKMDLLRNNLLRVSKEVQELTDAILNGNLSARGKADTFAGDWQKLVGGINALIEAFVKPIEMASDYVARIGKGDIPPKVVDSYNGDFNTIKNNLNACIDGLGGLVEANQVMQKMAVNDLTTQVEGSYQGIFADVARATNLTQDRIKHVADVMKGVAAGDYDKDLAQMRQIGKRSENDELVPSFLKMMDGIELMAADIQTLSKAAVEGNLSARVDAARHQGVYSRIVQGVNNTLDALVGFLDNVPSPVMIIDKDFQVLYMNKVGAGLGKSTCNELVRNKQHCYDFFKTSDCKTDKCACSTAMRNNSPATSQTDAHPGGYSLDIQYTGVPIRNKNGEVIGALEIVTDQTAVKKAARLSEKVAKYQQAEVARISSNLSKIALGDLKVDLSLAEADADTKDTRDSFATISGALARSVDAITALAADMEMLSKAAVEGKLSVRADISKHQGKYRNVVQGINETLDAVIAPVQEAGEALQKVAAGDLTAQVRGQLPGRPRTNQERH